MKLFKIKPNKYENEFSVTFQEQQSEDGIRKCALFNVFDDDKMIAYSRVVVGKKRHFGYFAEMFVRKNYQGRGLGQKLLDIRTEYAQNNDCTKIAVSFLVDDKIEQRKHLYVRNNWIITPSGYSAEKYITRCDAEHNKILPPTREMLEAKFPETDFKTLKEAILKDSTT